MNSTDILYDHYKESFSLTKEAQTRRNKSFIFLCLLEALSFLIYINPNKAFGLLLDGIKSKLGISLTWGNTILQTLLWILIIYVLIRYIQDMLYVERQYTYLQSLEEAISHSLATNVFNREGENYQKDYPMVLNFIDLFYKMFIPIFFIGINTLRIYMEWMSINQTPTLALICDTFLYGALFILTWFYFFEIHPKITNFCKRHLPLVEKAANILREILQKV